MCILIPCNASDADMAARLLGVDAIALATCLVTKTVRVRGEALASNATVEQAQVCKTRSQCNGPVFFTKQRA
jgi:myosin heavy subunit